MKNQTLLLCVICIFSFSDTFCCNIREAELNRTQDEGLDGTEVHVGVILDMESWQGKVIQSSISMAISDFCSLHNSYKERVILHVRNSQGDPFRALSAALDLFEDAKVEAILGAQISLEARFLAEFGERNKIPVISFSTPTSFPLSTRSPFFVQIGDDQTSQIKGVVALIELYKWRNVIVIHDQQNNFDLDNIDDAMSYLAALLEEKNIHISFVSSIASSFEDDQIIEQLHELKTLQTTIFIVHLPHSLASRLFLNAKRLGMISKGYAWMVTSKSMNHFNSRSDSSTIELMQGVIGFRSYIPATNELQNFTSRLRRKFADQAPDEMQSMQLNLGLLAYDVAWGLAKAAERAVVKVPGTSKPDARSKSSDLDIYRTPIRRLTLLQEIMRSNFKGLGGEFRFVNGKLISNMFEIVNVIGNREKRVGFCSSTGRITKEKFQTSHRRQLSDFSKNLESIIWPGGSSAIPQGRLLQTSGKILKIGVPVKKGFSQFVKVTRDPYTNPTNVTGFCIDVFKAAVEGLNYQVQYEFTPFMDANGNMAGTYNDLIHQVYLKNFDGVVGDTTITENRSLYVDFTIPYTDLGVGIVAPSENKDMWIIFKPLTPQLCLTIVSFHIISCCAIWLIERQTPRHVAEGLPATEPNGIRFSSILVVNISGEQLRNEWSKCIAAVSLFVLIILSSSYTATLASMMTVQNIELNSKGSYIGYQEGSINITTGVWISNLNFENNTLKPFATTEEYANALSKGSKNGGVSAILDEIPYIKIFLAEYSADYSLVKSLSTTNGFGFVSINNSLCFTLPI
ncbi:hypothetical protein DITRI_Ditri13aG0126900 [Diplodiscus trichospermus]